MMQGQTVVVVTSGANMNFDRLRLVAELAGVGARTEAMLVTTIPERPGAFHAFAGAALMQTDTQVTEFKYRWVAAWLPAGRHQAMHASMVSCFWCGIHAWSDVPPLPRAGHSPWCIQLASMQAMPCCLRLDRCQGAHAGVCMHVQVCGRGPGPHPVER